MKVTGQQWNAFLASWPDGQWFDDSDETVNGLPQSSPNFPDVIKDDDVVEITMGTVYRDDKDDIGKAVTSVLRAWLKAQTVTAFITTIPNELVPPFMAWLVANGGRATKVV